MERITVKKTASQGIAVAPVYCYSEPDLTPDVRTVPEEAVPAEQKKFADAGEAVKKELESLAAGSEIFAAHLEIVEDVTLQEKVNAKIAGEHKNAQAAVAETIDEIAMIFEAKNDTYLKERGEDIRDIGKRLMAALKGVKRPDLGNLSSGVIVAARDLYPSDTVKLNPEMVKGILTEEGGVTSHVSIIARSLNIPMLVGVKGILEKVENGETVCMDAAKGVIVVGPDEAVIAEYQAKKAAYQEERVRLEALRERPAVTKDGKRILLCANVGNTEEIRQALPMKIDGIGLFRSEFLYMESTHFPTEEEQVRVYKEAAELCPEELTIRTLDIGGDKELSYFPLEKEENPFLGWRAIRISLDRKEMFKEQIRAILRASAFGHVRILFPMIVSLEELREAKDVVEECKRELAQEGIAFDEKVETGMMMETPASVLLAEEFAKEADFFSIGTNDLTQYLLAVDRGNPRVADRYSYFHPAVVKAIRQIIEAGHREGIRVGMCGEMAGDPKAVEMLLEMGLDEFSMAAGSIDYVRTQIVNAVSLGNI
ncbi:MAG: phosphoenolpyruvate--protein phosphotransferase [Eubacteriales bacterium]|nr:phosphoenolpyruvate--protein phosphotransferase [Eubacteriales bacterium]